MKTIDKKSTKMKKNVHQKILRKAKKNRKSSKITQKSRSLGIN